MQNINYLNGVAQMDEQELLNNVENKLTLEGDGECRPRFLADRAIPSGTEQLFFGATASVRADPTYPSIQAARQGRSAGAFGRQSQGWTIIEPAREGPRTCPGPRR